jgi:predicted hydrocarbon binding protein/predicted amino acid-binding ACT domain protein
MEERSLKKSFQSLVIPRIVKSSGSELVGFALKIANKPGSLARIINVLSEMNVNLLSIEGSAKKDDLYADSFFVADVSNSKVEAQEIKEKLCCLDNVLLVEIVTSPSREMLFDSFHFPLFTDGSRVVITTLELWKGFFDSAIKKFGEDIVKTFLIHSALGSGKKLAETIKTSGLKRHETINLLLQHLKSLGWFNFEIIRRTDKSLKFLIYDNWEIEFFRSPGCAIVRAILTNFVKYKFNGKVSITEIECSVENGYGCIYVAKLKDI